MTIWMDPVLLKVIPFPLGVNLLKHHLNIERPEADTLLTSCLRLGQFNVTTREVTCGLGSRLA